MEIKGFPSIIQPMFHNDLRFSNYHGSSVQPGQLLLCHERFQSFPYHLIRRKPLFSLKPTDLYNGIFKKIFSGILRFNHVFDMLLAV